jgi:hypothetical protein
LEDSKGSECSSVPALLSSINFKYVFAGEFTN